MPTVIFSKAEVEKSLGKRLPLDQLKERISMLGTDLEKVEGDEIHVEIFPNRPDLLSEQGFARALSSFLGLKTGLRNYPVKKSGCKVMVDKSVSMRPYTACAIVKNLTFTNERIREMMQVQEKLATTHGRNRKKSAYGIYPADAISFPVKYVAKDPATLDFWPRGFSGYMKAAEVLEKHPKGKVYAHLTAGWKKFPFFIDAKGNVMCMLPLTNSQDTGKVTEQTKSVFVECTGTDFPNVNVALNILVTMLADMGGEICSIEMVYPDKTFHTPTLEPLAMKVDWDYINKWLGLDLKENQFQTLLGRMGYGYMKGKVLIPAYRADILHQVDIAEDVAIAYGYENFKEEIPQVATIGAEDPLGKFKRKLQDILVGLQLLEVKNYHLIAKEVLNEKMNKKDRGISLKNALGEYNTLRDRLISGLLKNLTENQHNEYPQNIFELGRTFFLDDKEETGVKEIEKLAVAICHEKADFTELKQMLDLLISTLGLEYKVKECVLPSYIPGRVGKIVCQGVEIGCIGELHPQVLENWNLIMPAVVLELDMEKLWEFIG